MSDNCILKDLPKIETKRLILRKISIDDIHDMFEYTSEPNVSKYTTWYPHESIEDTKEFVNMVIDKYKDKSGMTWGIEHKVDKKLIGTIDFVEWIAEVNRAEIGYALSEKYWNKGYMTEAAKALITFGFENLNLIRIQAKCYVENIGSAKVMEKSGMQYEGTLRKYFYSKGSLQDIKMYYILK